MSHPGAGTCLNCGTRLAGPWCHRCGQRAEAEHRSLRRVALETIEILTHADSRLWRTLSGLALHPARLTLDYLAGRRAAQIPPLRLFFVMLLLLFGIGAFTNFSGTPPSVQVDRPGLARALQSARITGQVGAWLQTRILHAAANPRGFFAVVQEWSERFAFMMLPISTLLLGAIFIADRRVMMFDHVIFSLHSLSFCLLVLSVMALPLPPLADAVSPLLLLVLPVHLFVHMRGVYGTRPFGTALRMLVLGAGTMVASLILIAALLLLGLQFENH